MQPWTLVLVGALVLAGTGASARGLLVSDSAPAGAIGKGNIRSGDAADATRADDMSKWASWPTGAG